MHKVWVFFYGTFMNARVLHEHHIACDPPVAASVTGYALSIRPRVNLVPHPSSQAYGGLALIDHEALAHLYTGLRSSFGIRYNPYAVLAEQSDGTFRPALCFMADVMPDAPADPVYVNELMRCAAAMDAPESYIAHINSFIGSTT